MGNIEEGDVFTLLSVYSTADLRASNNDVKNQFHTL